MTVEVSSCTTFQIFPAPPQTPLGELVGLENTFLTPGKPRNLVFASPEKSRKIMF